MKNGQINVQVSKGQSSRMVCLTNPNRFGIEVVDIFFGEVRPRTDQKMICAGDCARIAGGEPVQFEFREGQDAVFTRLEA